MEVLIQEGGSKIQLLYVLWVLENYSDENNTLKQDDIVRILKDRGYHTERKSVGRDLRKLLDFGYKIHGIEPELDEEGNDLPMKRGAIWLEREFSDEQLALLTNSVMYNVFIEKKNKEELLKNIISLGSFTFRDKHKALDTLNGGRIYQVEGATLLEQIKVIEKAIETEKRIRFSYSKLKRSDNKFIYEKQKEYVVSPYWIVVKNGNTYLVCYNHGENKIWNCRVDKIKDVEIIKTELLNKRNTELGDMSVGTYVARHPNMFTGDPIPIELRVDKNYMAHVLDTFEGVETIKETESTLTVKFMCGELDMFYWAIQFGGFVEVLSPQSLRDKIRYHIEGMTFKYKGGDGDKYTEAVKKVRLNGDLDLTGVEIGSRVYHESLTNVKSIRLSDNGIKDINFLRNYERLNFVSIANNPITDLSALADLDNVHTVWLENLKVADLAPLAKMKKLKYLHLELGRDVDYSAINDMKSLEKLVIPENDSYHLDNVYLEKNRADLEIVRTPYRPKKEAKIGGNRTSPYPLIVLKEALGYNNKLVGDEDCAIKAVEKMLNSLPVPEKMVAYLYFREDYNEPAISEELKISIAEVNRRIDSIKKKISHPSYNSALKEFVEIAFPKSSDAIQKLKEIVGIKHWEGEK